MGEAGKRNIKRNFKNRLAVTGIMMALMITICISVTSVVFAGNNKKEEPLYKYYTSIEIEPGDSLWSIANEYCYDMDMSVKDYIKELKELNHLSTDSITSGQYLTIMYVSSEYK